MICPLPKNCNHLPEDCNHLPEDCNHLPQDCNRGLYYSKFFNQWANGYEEVIKPSKENSGGKVTWINNFTGKIKDPSSAASRIKALAEASNGEARIFQTTGPFVTGMGLGHPIENGFLFHHTLGVPYLPGSSIKGMLRAWVRDWVSDDEHKLEDEITHLFGNAMGKNPQVGKIIVFDALPAAEFELYSEVITPHDGGWRIVNEPKQKDAPADWVNPVPIHFLAVKEGGKFQFALGCRGSEDDSKEDMEKAWCYLAQALEWIGAGAKTAVGFGRFKSEAARPPEVGERVEFIKATAPQDYLGRVGRVNKIIPTKDGERFQIAQDDGKGKIRGVFPFSKLRRLADED